MMDGKRSDNDFRIDNNLARIADNTYSAKEIADKILAETNGIKAAVTANGGNESLKEIAAAIKSLQNSGNAVPLLSPLNFINSAALQPFTLYNLYNIRFKCQENLGLSVPDKIFCVFYSNSSFNLYKHEVKIICSTISGDIYNLQFDWPDIAKEKYQRHYHGTLSLFWEKYGYYDIPLSYIPINDKRICYPLIASWDLFFGSGKSYIVRDITDKLQIKVDIPFIGSIVFSDIKAHGVSKPTFTATVQSGWDMSHDDYMRNPFWYKYWGGNAFKWQETPDSWGAKAIYLSGTQMNDDSGAPIPQWTSRCQLLNTTEDYWGRPQELEYPIVFIGNNGNISDTKILCDLTLSLFNEENITLTGLGDKVPVKDALQTYINAISLF